jgi:hypothetical protein
MKKSNYCNENIISESINVCSRCKEHCEVINDDALDGVRFSLENIAKKREPLTKEAQIGTGRMKPKKESTFGKPSTKGTFGKKPTVWNKNKKSTTPKIKKSDVIDETYLKWLAQKACVVTGLKAQRGIGADNIHIHHIYSRNKGRNDYKAVPLMGFAHSWGGTAYHSNTKDDYIKKHKLIVEDIIEYFEDCANDFLNEYIEQGNELKQ